VAGKEWGEVFGDADRADSRSSTAVRDAKGLVKIEVADVGTDTAG
jgi:hypothetical protein